MAHRRRHGDRMVVGSAVEVVSHSREKLLAVIHGSAQGRKEQGSLMEQHFQGLQMQLGNLSRLSNARTRSISAENPTGAKGGGGRATEGTGAKAARDLGLGWKISPSVVLAPQA